MSAIGLPTGTVIFFSQGFRGSRCEVSFLAAHPPTLTHAHTITTTSFFNFGLLMIPISRFFLVIDVQYRVFVYFFKSRFFCIHVSCRDYIKSFQLYYCIFTHKLLMRDGRRKFTNFNKYILFL